MPTVHIIDGIKITMYHEDHNPPHFHVIQGDHKFAMTIEGRRGLHGKAPVKIVRKAARWARMNSHLLWTKWRELHQ